MREGLRGVARRPQRKDVVSRGNFGQLAEEGLVRSHMCGIAGYSLHRSSPVSRTLAAQALLAAIAERGADAAGYAYRGPGAPLTLHKQRTGASALQCGLSSLPSASENVGLAFRPSGLV